MAVVEGTSAGFVTVSPSANPAGAGAGPLENYGVANKYTSPADIDEVTEMGWYASSGTSDTPDHEVGIYSHDAGNNRPNVLLGRGGPVAISGTEGWQKIGSLNIGLSQSTTYWVAAQADNSVSVLNVDYDTDAGYKMDYTSSGATTLPEPWGVSGGTLGRIEAIYALYTTVEGSVSPSPSASPSATVSPSPSASPSVSPSVSPSASPSVSASPSATVSPSPSASPSVSASPSASVSSSPSVSPSASPSVSASPSATVSPSPSASPSVSASPSASISSSPSVSPSASPSATASPSPSASPSVSVSASPSASASVEPGGGIPEGLHFRIELRDRAFNLLEILDKDAHAISWKYNRIGGCGNFSFNLARKYDAPKALSGFFDVRIYKRNSANDYSLWFSGYVEEKEGILSEEEEMSVIGIGYVGQLRTVIVDATYTDDEISVIVKDILDNYVLPNTDITYDAGDIENTGFTADKVEFKTDALRAFETLAEIAGEREWGVGADRKFFFKARNDDIGERFVRGKQIREYTPVFNFREIVNKLYLEGGDVAGSKYTRSKTNSQSILKYGTLEAIISNSSITTDTVADQYLAAVLEEKSDLNIKAKLRLIEYSSRLEDSIPLSLIEIMELGVRYGEDYYGNFLYSGDLVFRINNISYKLADRGGLLGISLDLGQRKISLPESIGRLDYKIEQLRQARV